MYSYLDTNPNTALQHEEEVVWLYPPENFRYVREDTQYLPRRRARPRISESDARHLVGYTVLSPNAPNSYPGRFLRRIFWVKANDYYYQPEGVYKEGLPSEGVYPSTIEPGKPSRSSIHPIG